MVRHSPLCLKRRPSHIHGRAHTRQEYLDLSIAPRGIVHNTPISPTFSSSVVVLGPCLIHGATRVEPASTRLETRGSACGDGHWPEHLPGMAPEFQVQSRMRASAIVVTNEFLQDEAQVPLVGRNQVIQTLAPDRPNEPFAIRVGSRRANPLQFKRHRGR
jgi:hypothetical protein